MIVDDMYVGQNFHTQKTADKMSVDKMTVDEM